MQYIYKGLGLRIEIISQFNHSTLKSQSHIRNINEMTTKQITGHTICNLVLMHTILQAQH